MPITAKVALRSTMLPPLHQDLADRLLVATAIEHGWILVTPDPLIRKYEGVSVFWG